MHRVVKPLVIAFGVLMVLVARPCPASAAGGRFALLVEGASGEEQYAVQHRAWLDAFASLFATTFKYDAQHLVVLAEQPKANEQKATAEILKAAVARIASAMTPDDQLAVILIGHGSGQGTDVKFNLVGPDLGVAEWAAVLKPVPGRIVLIDTTSSSFPYLAGLSAPGRVIVTATNSAAQRYHTVFPDALLDAFNNQAADLDKSGRTSVLEAFTYASRVVKERYEKDGTMATEIAAIDDNGDAKGRDASATGPDGPVAAATFLDAPATRTSADPETQRLLDRQQALTEQIDDLRRRQSSMPADVFDPQLEKLLTELATVSADLRRRR
jgi:hypothetical protein